MSERVLQTTGDTLPEYRQDLPETPEPCRLCEPQGISELKEGPVSGESGRDDLADGPVEIDLAIGVGEDPGWYRSRRARFRTGRPSVTVRHGA